MNASEKLIALLATFLCSTLAHGSGLDLLQGCSRSENSWGNGYCTGYITAVTAASKERKCIPASATVQQITMVVTKYLTEHPEKLNANETPLILEAIAKAWPCSGK